MALWLWLSAFAMLVATSVLASEDSVLMTGVCDGKLHQLAQNIRRSTEDVLTTSAELALIVFSGFSPLLRSKKTLKASASRPHAGYPFLRASRNSAPHLMSDPVNLKSLYLALTKALKLRSSDKQLLSFTSALEEIKAEYLKACFSAGPKPTLESLSSDLATARATKDEERKQYLLRSGFAKATCFEKRVAKIQSTVAEFFSSITPDEAKDMFGFHFILKEDFFPTLAFVIDTTGSMSDEIVTATKVIGEIIKIEQQNPFFYVLTPFNDYGDDPTYKNYGPNTVATTRDDFGPAAEELNALYLAVKSLRAYGGGDAPEYCMNGILEAFRANYKSVKQGYTLPLYANGSQIIVITDDKAKDAGLKSEVIRLAVGSDTQINFILTPDLSSYSLYNEIADATSGVVVYSTFANGGELKILADLASLRIATAAEHGHKRERKAGVEANCFEYITSKFTSNVNGFVSSAATSVIVTSPDGVMVEMRSNTAFNTNWPLPGKWKICAPSGVLLKVNLESKTEINFAVSFLVENTSDILVAEVTPSICTNGKLMVTFLDMDGASNVSSTEPLYLDFLGEARKVETTVTLSKCDEILTGSIRYPKEVIVFMSLRGLDTNGNRFEYTTKEPRSLSFIGPSGLRFDTSEPASVPVPITTYRDFSFTLLTDSDGLFNINVSFSSTSSHLFLTPLQGTTVVLNRSARISVSVLVKASAPLNQIISFIVKATYITNCDLGASYSKSILVSPNVGPVDKCGGCTNGGTCVSIIGKNRCLCRPGYIGIYCQTELP